MKLCGLYQQNAHNPQSPIRVVEYLRRQASSLDPSGSI